MSSELRAARFVEYMRCRPGQVESDLVRNVKVLAWESRNGRVYRRSAVKEALSLYESVPVFINHSETGGDRRYEDHFGRLINVKLKDTGLFADLKFNPKHKLAEQFIWDSQNSPESLGLSHVVDAVAGRDNGKTTIESIKRVVSVDLVCNPASTTSLYESETPPVRRQRSVFSEDMTAKEFAAAISDQEPPATRSQAKAFADRIVEKKRDCFEEGRV